MNNKTVYLIKNIGVAGGILFLVSFFVILFQIGYDAYQKQQRQARCEEVNQILESISVDSSYHAGFLKLKLECKP